MRIVKYTSRFKRDYRREKSGQLGKQLDRLLIEIVDMLAMDRPKLMPHQQGEALARRERGEALTEIARGYNISHSTVSRLPAAGDAHA